MQLVMLAAGMGTRFGGCKPLAPVGINGDALIDVTASDARAAGFDGITVITGPKTGPAIRYHISRCWQGKIDVSFAHQEVPLGTAHAVVCAEKELRGRGPFGVVNGDDIYGVTALAKLREYLSTSSTNCLVAFALRNTIITDAPVTRGICLTGSDGTLKSITERKQVSRISGDEYISKDGLEPSILDPDAPVSMNLWGFQPEMLDYLSVAVAEGIDRNNDAEEILLPEVVGDMLDSPSVSKDAVFKVLTSNDRCIGVTHATDLSVVTSILQSMIGVGERPESLWSNHVV
ncbi:MAG: sugar phosphate nucleotidyltransferase [Actinobacteria bacterium]|jgi:NDP-sugar pyrophosphorylase family protein|nr:sugar phosphate nucleotidyltransferase [Actinomycetota bacterium]